MLTLLKKVSIAKLIMILLLSVSEKIYAQSQTYDLCIYGGSSAGVVAAYTAKKMGKSVIVIEPSTHLGGLTSGGLGQTDIGNKYVVSGVSLDFYRKLGAYYGKLEQWIFEPKVAKQIFEQYIKEADVPVMFKKRLVAVEKSGIKITSITVENSDKPGKSSYEKISAKMFLDCSYEGDLMAKSKVSFIVGREANSTYNETFNGVQFLKQHQFKDGIDPYKIPGDPKSGLLWGISNGKLAPNGTGDRKVQAYNIRICLTSNPSNRISITRPARYDSTRYELFIRNIEKYPPKSIGEYLIVSRMPNHKTDINNRGGFSTDMIGMNWEYPEGDYETRKKIHEAHNDYTKGFLYFLGNDPRIPEHLRKEMLRYGYPKDEYVDNNHWSPQLYVREARRMIGQYVMTQANCVGKEVVTDEIGRAAYTMDSHNVERLVVNGMVKNEGNVEQGGFDPYAISYGSIIPKASECTNLFVPICMSASHIAYGSIRMEPVFMVLAQSAAVAAVLAIDNNQTVQNVSVKDLQRILRENPYADGRTPDVLVDNRDVNSSDITGNWGKKKKGGYGLDYLVNADTVNKSSVKFTPEIKEDGVYKVYSYYPKLAEGSEVTSFAIFDGKTNHEKVINKKDVKVLGQTSGVWLPLGEYKLAKGKAAYVEIANNQSNGTIVADAILCVKK